MGRGGTGEIQSNKREKKEEAEDSNSMGESLRIKKTSSKQYILKPNPSIVQTWEAQAILSLNSREGYSREQ